MKILLIEPISLYVLPNSILHMLSFLRNLYLYVGFGLDRSGSNTPEHWTHFGIQSQVYVLPGLQTYGVRSIGIKLNTTGSGYFSATWSRYSCLGSFSLFQQSALPFEPHNPSTSKGKGERLKFKTTPQFKKRKRSMLLHSFPSSFWHLAKLVYVRTNITITLQAWSSMTTANMLRGR